MKGIFDNLPFVEAIQALAEREAVVKEPGFLEMDAAARSRAFTLAFVDDVKIVQSIHDELSITIAEGEDYRQFALRLVDLAKRNGAGPEAVENAWHWRLVYEQNLGMAYSAGRMQQAQSLGVHAWRYLPSGAVHPREDHRIYYGQLFRFEPGDPLPPIDFNCSCGWETVTDEELEAMGLDWRNLPRFQPPVPESGFIWDPSAYVNAA